MKLHLHVRVVPDNIRAKHIAPLGAAQLMYFFSAQLVQTEPTILSLFILIVPYFLPHSSWLNKLPLWQPQQPWSSTIRLKITRCWRSLAVSAHRLERGASGTYFATGGSFGTVFKAREKSTGELVAIKHVRCNIPIKPDVTNCLQ